jgi:NADH dehydrogenase [ubiquinone] 1 alpha subcomplex assembly factor 7
MGMDVRVDALVKNASSEERKVEIDKAAKRLVDPVGMGREYQVLGLSTNLKKDSKGNVWPFMDVEQT